MSFLDRIAAANCHDLAGYLRFTIAGVDLGWMTPEFAERVSAWPEVFDVRDDRVMLSLALDAPTARCAERTEAIGAVTGALREAGEFPGWRNELYPIAQSFGERPLALVERAAVAAFGIRTWSIHVNGFVNGPDGTEMWIARRSVSKPTYPGALDQIVAGGQPHGITVRDNVVKECAEEAGIEASLARRARAVGAIRYAYETARGIKPDTAFVFDLELEREFRPINCDGEVDAFYLWPIERVAETVANSTTFKLNCALVVIDFLIRHGRLDPDGADYDAIVSGLAGKPHR